MKYQVFHESQLSGEWVATCQTLPGWFSWGETLEESCYHADHDLRHELAGRPEVAHYEVPVLVNQKLRAVA